MTTFGVLDDDGDVIPQKPVSVGVRKFSEDSFADAQRAIAAERDRMAVP